MGGGGDLRARLERPTRERSEVEDPRVVEDVAGVPVGESADPVAQDEGRVRGGCRGREGAVLRPALDALAGAVAVGFGDGAADDVGCACVDLEVVDLDLEDDVGGVVDGEDADGEALEICFGGRGGVGRFVVWGEGVDDVSTPAVEVGFPGVV